MKAVKKGWVYNKYQSSRQVKVINVDTTSVSIVDIGTGLYGKETTLTISQFSKNFYR